MNLNYDSFILQAPFSLLFSIFLFYGCYCTGNYIIEKFKLKDFFLGEKNYKFFSILLVINIIQPILYISALAGFGFKIISLIIGTIIIFFSIFNLSNLSIEKKKIKFFAITLLPLILYFFSSLGPITNADSLDYHAGVAAYILNYGQYPDLKIWFHSIQAGAGEVLISLSFFLKSEQFASLIQFSGLISIFGSFYYLIKNSTKKKFISNIFFIIVVISSPLFIQLSTSIKPQLFYIGTLTFLFTLIFFSKFQFRNKRKTIYILFLIFLSNAFLAKFNFLLSSSILFLTFVINKIDNKKNLLEFLIISVFCFFILVFPTFLFKNSVYGINFISFFLSPFPLDIHGYDDLYRSIVSDRVKLFSLNISNWFNILIPTNITNFTNSIGLGIILFLYLRVKNKLQFQIILFSILYILVIFLMGQQSGRFVIEPYLWLSLLSFHNFQKVKNYYGIFHFSLIQPFLIFFVLIYSIVFLTSGSLTNELRKKVLEITANGYELSQWVDKSMGNLDEPIIYTHRSISLPNLKVIPGDYLYYIKLDTKKDFEENKIFFKEIIDISPKYILFYKEKFKNEGSGNPYNNYLKCTGKLLFTTENAGKEATRNFFLNKQYKNYSAYIYEFKLDNFPECLK